MHFHPTTPSHSTVLTELRSKHYAVVELAYLLGQHRIQVWQGAEVVGVNF